MGFFDGVFKKLEIKPMQAKSSEKGHNTERKLTVKGVYTRETYSDPNWSIIEMNSPSSEINEGVLTFCKTIWNKYCGYYCNISQDFDLSTNFLPPYFTSIWLESDAIKDGDWSELVVTIFGSEPFALDLESIMKLGKAIDWDSYATDCEF